MKNKNKKLEEFALHRLANSPLRVNRTTIIFDVGISLGPKIIQYATPNQSSANSQSSQSNGIALAERDEEERLP